jgi:hypothetical protein
MKVLQYKELIEMLCRCYATLSEAYPIVKTKKSDN